MIAEFTECLPQRYAEDFTVTGSFMSSSLGVFTWQKTQKIEAERNWPKPHTH